MEEQNISTSQLNTKQEAAIMQQAANENVSTPEQENLKEKENKNLMPLYNPLLGMTKGKYAALISGQDQEHPLYTTNQNGAIEFHPENAQYKTSKVSKISANFTTGDWDVQNRREHLNKTAGLYKNELDALYAETTSSLMRTQDRTNAINRMLGGFLTGVAETSRSFDDIFLSNYYALKSIPRYIEEAKWKTFWANQSSEVKKEVAAFKDWLDKSDSVKYANANAEDLQLDPYSVEKNLAFSERKQNEFGLSEEGKEVMRKYRDLIEEREADERNMMVMKAFEESPSAIWGNEVNKMTEMTDRDMEESLSVAIGSFSGQVAGSLGAAWVEAATIGGAVGLAGKAVSGIKKLFTGLDAFNLAKKGAAATGLAQAAALNTKLITAPVFLQQFYQIRTEALLSGKSLGDATGIAILAGAAEAALEFAGFKIARRFYKADGFIRNYLLKNIIPEALQEASQTTAENIITEGFGVTDKQFTDIMYEIGMSLVAGGIGGFVFTMGRMRAEGMAAYTEAIAEELVNKLGEISQSDFNIAYAAAMESARIEEVNQIFAEVAEKQKAREQIKQDLSNLTKEQKAAHDSILEWYKNMRKFALARVNNFNPNATTQQKQNILDAIKVLAEMERNGKQITSHFNAACNMIVSYLNVEEKSFKANQRAIEKKLLNSGLNRQQTKTLMSSDLFNKNEEQWALAEQHLINEFMQDVGISKAEATAAAKLFVSGQFKAYTLLNKNITPLQFVRTMHSRVLDVQKAILFNMRDQLPEMFNPVLSRINTVGFNDEQNLTRLTTALLQENIPDSESIELNKALYGQEDFDPNLEKLRSLMSQQMKFVKDIVGDMALETNIENFTDNEYMQMTILSLFNNTNTSIWTLIFDRFGLKLRDKRIKDIDSKFNEKREELFGNQKPSDAKMKDLIKMANRINKGQTEGLKQNIQENKKAQQKIEKGASLYSPTEDLIVLQDNKTGTFFHEYGHFALTRMLDMELKMNANGLTFEGSPLLEMRERLAKLVQQEGRTLSEREFQETILDAARTYIIRGQSSDPVITGLLTELKQQGYDSARNIADSLWNKEGYLTKKQKEEQNQYRKNILQEIDRIIGDTNPYSIIGKAMELRKVALLDVKVGSPLADNLTSRSAQLKQAMADKIRTFIQSVPLKDADELGYQLDQIMSIKEGSTEYTLVIPKLIELAGRVANEGVDFATDVIADNQQLFSGNVNARTTIQRESVDGARTPFFMSTAATLPANAEFRPQENLWKEFKDNKWEWTKEKIKAIIDFFKDYLMSLEGGAEAVHQELQKILMEENFRFHRSVQLFRNAVEPVVTAVDQYKENFNKTHNSSEIYEEDKKWRLQFHAALGDGDRAEARKFLASRIGEEHAKEWNNVIDILDGSQEKYNLFLSNPEQYSDYYVYQGIRSMLLEAGFTDSDLGQVLYFPMVVKDYKGLTQDIFGQPHTYSEIEKIQARAKEEYAKKNDIQKDKQTGEYKFTPEQELELNNILTDLVNSRFQRNYSDENRVTAFFKRRQFDYHKRPEMLRYYEDPFSALDKYMEAAYRTVMNRKLFGRIQTDNDGNIIIEKVIKDKNGNVLQAKPKYAKVGHWLVNNPTVITEKAEAVERFQRFVKDFVMRESTDKHSILTFVRETASLTMLTNPFSVLNQFLDLEFVFSMYGTKATLQAMKDVILSNKNTNVTRLTDIYAQPLNEQFRTEGQSFTSRLTRKAFKVTGFEWADKTVKEIAINAMNNRFKQIASDVYNKPELWTRLKNPATRQQAIKEFEDFQEFYYLYEMAFPKQEIDSIPRAGKTEDQYELEVQQATEARDKEWIDSMANLLQDFKDGKQTEDVKYMQFLMLTKMQPIDAMAVPAKYNGLGGYGRLLYQFNTVAIRQMGMLRTMAEMKLKTRGPRAAAEQMLKFASFALAIGIPKEALEGFLKGRESDLGDFILSPMHVFMINSYFISQCKSEGIPAALADNFTPKFGIFNNITKDAIRFVSGKDYKGYTWKNVPVFGQLFWHWFFGGRDAAVKQDKALFHTDINLDFYDDIIAEGEQALSDLTNGVL